MRIVTAGFAAVASIAVLVAGCVVGGDKGDRLELCSSYPDDQSKCWQPWDGHLVQACGDSGRVATRLYFDRPEVPDSARVNVMELGNVPIGEMNELAPFHDTMILCDRGMCRHLAVEMTILGQWSPNSIGSLFLEFQDSTDIRADKGSLRIDSLSVESCP